MNSFSNTTTLYNHSEPILEYPTSGMCSLLTGNDRDNITSDIYQPCCTNASAVSYERSACICEEDHSCDTCLAQHAQEFKLIAAVCNKNGANSRTGLGIGILLLAFAPSVLQMVL
ncbi:hypothetical protein GGR57DRAFT_75559 [Xylariaceae sp. FL1272]|nr:hypothetical protein GGR57DRAFT_75559 [Xylariaceae sp. FL1272]